MVLPRAQKLRLVINGVSIFTTAGQIREGIGDFQNVNTAIKSALALLEYRLSDEKERRRPKPFSVTGQWFDYQVQLDMHG
jgi:hypothetical protein